MRRDKLMEDIEKLIEEADTDSDFATETAISKSLIELIKAEAFAPELVPGIHHVAKLLAEHNLDYDYEA